MIIHFHTMASIRFEMINDLRVQNTIKYHKHTQKNNLKRMKKDSLLIKYY